MNETNIVQQLTHRDMDRISRYKELLDFYHGQHWEGRERRGEKRLTFNYAKVFIDKVTSYLMSGINFAVDAAQDSDEARARAQRAEAALYQVYEDNNLEQLDFETEIDCAILGDACYKVIWRVLLWRGICQRQRWHWAGRWRLYSLMSIIPKKR